jgi:hypothetical protein
MSQKQAETDTQSAGNAASSARPGSWASIITQIWTRDYLAYPWVLPSLAAVFVAYLTCLALLGPPPATLTGNDVVILLDGGWRILNGLVPHHDFYLSLGSITYMWVAFGLWVTHYAVSGLTIGFLSFASIIAVFAFLISRNRMTAAATILFSFFILLLCTGPMPLGGNPSTDLSYAMVYNRFCYGILSILFVTQLLPPTNLDSRAQQDRFGSVVAGASLTLLFFLKVSYFGVGAGLVFLFIFADLKNAVSRLVAIAGGLVVTTLAMLAFLRFDITALVSDLLNTVRARASTNIGHFGITDVLGLSTTSFVALVLSLGFYGSGRAGGRHRGWFLAAAIYTVIAEALFVRTNALQGPTYPLYTAFILIVLAQIGRDILTSDMPAPFAAAIVVIGLGLMTPMFYVHLRSLALLATYKTSSRLKATASRIEGQHLRGLAFYDYDASDPAFRFENGHFYTGYVNDGIDLLKKNSAASDIVACLGSHNPFSYALLSKPPHAGSTWLILENNISDHMLSDERMFGNATVVMVPKFPSSHAASDKALFEEYKPYLLKHFRLVDESEWWRLYR